ncbi:MAG TPA: hypothetical protein VF532_11635 [Candidatus Angelobacter sp.]
MHRIQLLLLLSLVLALGAPPLAKGQDGLQELDRYKTQEPDTKQDKAKAKKQATNKNDDGHRKHWWSLPHFRHKKQESASNTGRTNASGKAAAVKPASKTGAPKNPSSKTTAVTRPSQKPKARTGQSAKAAAGTHTGRKTAAHAGQGAKSASGANASRKTTAGTSQAKKTVRHNCSPEEVKKGGCPAEKGQAAKGIKAS